jgi:putative nucleotidyltransferase with HDIG domain
VGTGAVNLALERFLEAARPRRMMPLAGRERVSELLFMIGFALAVLGLDAVTEDHAGFDWPLMIGLTLTFALVSRVRFEIGAGDTVPTQLVLIPMLFLAPPAAVPVMVAVGRLLGRLPLYVSGRVHLDRSLLVVNDAWHAIGPALVIGAMTDQQPRWEDWPIYVLAFAAQVAVDTGVSLVREWAATGIPPRLQMHVMGWVVIVDACLTPIGLLAAFSAAQESWTFLLVLPLVGVLKLFARERQQRIEQSIELSRAYRGTAQLLGDVIEDDDAYTGQHTKGVVLLADLVAEELSVDEETRRDAEFGALLHDVGKIAIPKEIIHKPGPLNEEEWKVMRTHTIEGQRLLERVGGPLQRVGQIVRASHERWDGKGYPDGLSAEGIPLAARIVSACDAYNAMTTDRPYRSALPVHVALAELRDNAGSQFDPNVVEALLRVITRWDPEMVADSPRSDELDAAIAELLAGNEPAEADDELDFSHLEDEDEDWPER